MHTVIHYLKVPCSIAANLYRRFLHQNSVDGTNLCAIGNPDSLAAASKARRKYSLILSARPEKYLPELFDFQPESGYFFSIIVPRR